MVVRRAESIPKLRPASSIALEALPDERSWRWASSRVLVLLAIVGVIGRFAAIAVTSPASPLRELLAWLW